MKAFIGLCCAGLLGYGVYSQFVETRDPAATGSVRATSPRATQDDPRSGLNVFNIDWRRDGYGLAAVVNVAVKNNNNYAVQLERIACDFRDKTGGKTEEHSQGVFAVIPAHGQQIVKNVGLGFVDAQLQGVGCKVSAARKG